MKTQKAQPPRWAERLLAWLAADHLQEEVQGDLQELFEQRLQTSGLQKARFLYVLDLLKLIHPRLWRNKHSSHLPSNPVDMFHHYLLLSFRTAVRFKGSFFINLIGLSTGLACALLIFLWVRDELSIDKFHENDSRLYQVMQNSVNGDGSIQTIEPTQGILADALAREIPEIEYAATVVPAGWSHGKGVITYNNRQMNAEAQFIGKDYFYLFTCPFIEGDKKGVINDKNSIAISDEFATKLFGSTQNAIGKTIEWNEGEFNGFYQITGVFKNPPANATYQFDLLFNYDLFLEKRPFLKEWGNSDPSTFVLLKEGTDLTGVNTKIKNFLESKIKETQNTLFLQRYSDKYLYNRYENGVVAGGRIEYVHLFSVIALFILFIACINFMNLSTAKASRRLKEVGIKKAIGAGRQGIIFQFLSESLFVTFISLFCALLLVVLLLPGFNGITGKSLTLVFDGHLILSLLALTICTGLISGSYPALYLSGFSPAMVLKGKLKGSLGELWARKGLVIFQFALSVVLIVSVLVVYQQIQFVQTKNLGYNRENIIHFEMQVRGEDDKNFFAEGGTHEKRVETYVNELKRIPGVIQAANYDHDVTGRYGNINGVDWQQGKEDETMDFANLQNGYDFIETLGIEIIQGRSFSREYSNERSKVIFNEEAIKRMGIQDPIGKKVKFWGQEKEIIGVARNFHFESLYEEVKPCMIQLEPRVPNIIVKITGGTEKESIARLEKFYQRHNPGLPFDYKFLDEAYQALYTAEQKVAVLSRYFAGVAIIISCLGLLGLAAFTAQRRRKEIGIRKVLGSGEFAIIRLLSGEFMGMVFAAILIALPISYLIARNWLQDFHYAIDLKWWFFAGAGLAALLIAGLTVVTQTLRAAKMNPVDTLRNE